MTLSIRSGATALVLALVSVVAVAAAAPAAARADEKADPHAGAKARVFEAARKAHEVAVENLRTGLAGPETVHAWSLRWMAAQTDFDPTGKVRAIEEHFERMNDLDELVKTMAAVGKASTLDVASATFFREEAKLWLETARAK